MPAALCKERKKRLVQEIITDDLRSCPFCGGEAELKVTRHPINDKELMARVSCKDCHCMSNLYITGQTMSFEGNPGRNITLAEAKVKAAEAWNRRLEEESTKKQERAREIYGNSLPFSEVAPMLEAAKLFEYSENRELIFCMNMARLYGGRPRQQDGNNFYNFLVTLYHYGKVQGIRKERAKRRGGSTK